MTRRFAWIAFVAAGGVPGVALAQAATDTPLSPGETAVAAAPATSTALTSVDSTGGVIVRDGASDNPFATIALTVAGQRDYVRASFTGFHTVSRQLDAALPATFVVGGIGFGGNHDGWVLDAMLYGGVQRYEAVQNSGPTIAGQAGAQAPFFSMAMRGGRVFRLGTRWFLTPTLGLQWGQTRSRRLRIDPMAQEAVLFELRERAWTGIAAMRLDLALGARRQHDLALTLTHFQSSNVMTGWSIVRGTDVVPTNNPGQWQELAAATNWQVSSRLWLATQTSRTFGLASGDGTTLSLGMHLQL